MTLSERAAPTVLVASAALSGALAAAVWPGPPAAAGGPDQDRLEAALLRVPDASSLRSWHDLLGSEPHVAGTPGDRRTIERLAGAFGSMGLEVQVHEVLVYLARPVAAALEIVEPVAMSLPLKEPPVAADPWSDHADLDAGWCAYSGNGDVTGEIVYANYGTREDFEKLRALGVDLRGRIVVARYGGNFRGYKARFAEAGGAAGLVIYTDPHDAGFRQGIPYPEGGWANERSVQRGSIATLDYPGDPLTPFEPATADARRMDPARVDLPRIPVQPVGWGAAAEILSRMSGPAASDLGLAGWQGGLPFAYRVAGGPGLKVRLRVVQERRLVPTANVLGFLRGAVDPDLKVIVGCHHDAWGCGASDPLAGTIVLLECARSIAEAARLGDAPARTLVFAAWAAEEHGIVGSVEWCEANRDDLARNAVAYLNLDMAAMGPAFGASGSPSLRRLVAGAARRVPQARAAGATVYDAWAGRGEPAGAPPFGSLGGGSDHVGFACHLGIPSCSLSAAGSRGTAYHSNYDTLSWYRKVVGEDYGPALMLARLTGLVAARLACDPIVPLDPSGYPTEARGQLRELAERARALDLRIDPALLEAAIDETGRVAAATDRRLAQAAAAGRLDAATRATVNRLLIACERSFVHAPGLPGRPWYRNLYTATDPGSGYAAWTFPALRRHVEERDEAGFESALGLHVAAFEALRDRLRRIEDQLGPGGPDASPAGP